MSIDNGGPAFPTIEFSFDEDTHKSEPSYSNDGMSLREYIAIHAPEPSKDEIDDEYLKDKIGNPHGDNYKPIRRGRLEIIADLRFKYADAMIAARKRVPR